MSRSELACFVIELKDLTDPGGEQTARVSRYNVDRRSLQLRGVSQLQEAIRLSARIEPSPADSRWYDTARLKTFKIIEEKLTATKYDRIIAFLGDAGHARNNGTETKTAEIPLAQIVQTNVTRFGTIILIVFLVSILTPLYRYNLRLATFYDARADVLELSSQQVRDVSFSDLAQTFTPAFDFGKPPATPMDQAIDLARQILKANEAKKTIAE